jgi:hypothetical protein
MTERERQHVEDLVIRRLPRSWRGSIRVDEIGILPSANGRPAGTTFVDISTQSKLARRQAMSSIGPYVENEPRDWIDGWTRVNDRFRIRIYGPSSYPVQPNILELEKIEERLR